MNGMSSDGASGSGQNFSDDRRVIIAVAKFILHIAAGDLAALLV
jgi:hypothetical protein